MKEFEKWWNNKRTKNYGYGTPTCQESRAENLAYLHDKEIWRAALEWVLNMFETNIKSPNNPPPFCVKGEIERELKE